MRRWARAGTWLLRLGVPAAVAVVAYRDRAVLAEAARVIGHAQLAWLLPGVLAIAGVSFSRAMVYGFPLRLLGYTFPRGFLFRVALMSSSLHQLIPVGGATGYAFLTYALNQRGAPAGESSVIALVDTLSYSAALATLVAASLAYMLTAGLVTARAMLPALAPGLAIAAIGVLVYYLQRDRARLERVVQRAGRWVTARLHVPWPHEAIRSFLTQYFKSKGIIARKPAVFRRMLAGQYCAIGCDAAALYTAFLAVGLMPAPWTVFMGFVVAMAGGSVVGAPGGGGSFELVMTSFFVLHHIRPADALAATLLYRIVAFWLPVGVTLVLLLRLRQRRKELRKTRHRAA